MSKLVCCPGNFRANVRFCYVYCSIISPSITLLESNKCYSTSRQDETMLHISSAISEFLKPFFHNWYPLAYNHWEASILPLNFFFWGTLKNKVSKTLQKCITPLKQRITMEIQHITWVKLKKIKNLLWRALICKTQLGSHFQYVLIILIRLQMWISNKFYVFIIFFFVIF